MSDTFSIKVVGLDKLLAGFENKEKQLIEGIVEGVNFGSAVVEGEIKKNVPVVTGNLMRSVTTVFSRDKMEAFVGPDSNLAPYGYYVEFGHSRSGKQPPYPFAGRHYVERSFYAVKDMVQRVIISAIKSRLISMAARVFTKVKQFMYDTLRNDVTLATLMGGTTNIYQQFSDVTVRYPAIFYGVVSDVPFPFGEDQGVSTSEEVVFSIDFESELKNTLEIDGIEERVFNIFNGKSFSNSNILVHNIEKIFYSQYFDTDAQLWRIVTRYRMKVSYK